MKKVKIVINVNYKLHTVKQLNLYLVKTGLLKLWVATPNKVAKQNGILCFVPQNFENPSSAAELLEKIMVIAHVIGKSENLGTKIDKLELDSECGPSFLENT